MSNCTVVQHETHDKVQRALKQTELSPNLSLTPYKLRDLEQISYLSSYFMVSQETLSISASSAVAAAYQRGVVRAVLAQHLAWVLSRWWLLLF